jgi:23S rRNA pseudouridine2605 synthase
MKSRRLCGAVHGTGSRRSKGDDVMPGRHSFPPEGPRSNPRRPRRPYAGAANEGARKSPAARGPVRARRAGAPDVPASTHERGNHSGKPDRLQKILAHAGLGSRRSCEGLILQGRVTVDGEVVRQLGTRVDSRTARIAVDGEPIELESIVFYAVNKPKGYVSTNLDPAGRPRVVDLLPEVPERVYTVGRLDEDSMGLIILTNDGDLANRLAHPRFGVEKRYRALVAGAAGPDLPAKLIEGVWLSDGKVRAKRARIVGRQGQATWLELVLAEGKKREIRRMLSKLGHKVMALTRTAVGPITLKGLAAGEARPLSRHEVDMLRKVAAGMSVSPAVADDESAPPRDRGPRRPPTRSQAQSGHGQEHGPPRRRVHARPGSAAGPVQRPPRLNQGKAARPAKRRVQDDSQLDESQPVLIPISPQPSKTPRIIVGLDSGTKSRHGAGAGNRKRARPPARRQRPAGLTLKKPRDLPSEPDNDESQEP